MLTPTYEERDHSETEPTSDQQLLCHSSAVVESQDQEGSQHGDSGSASHSRNVDTSPLSETQSKPPTGKKSVKCDTCDKVFKWKSELDRHLRIHTGERPYCCQTCGKSFIQRTSLVIHMRIHTGERPYSCQTCGKSFTQQTGLGIHMRTHTGKDTANWEGDGRLGDDGHLASYC
uniref:zinc finger protein 239-like n=1 Tax=Monopterus albus TaxID=43700 RepID=UPI0009B3D476|nr:zinc finger protein 239-like [Monopterus albus]